MRSVFAAWVLAAGLILPNTWGAALYSTSASSTFATAGMAVSVGSDGGFETEIGNAAASFGGTVSPGGTLPATRLVGTSGTASSPPNSLATSTYQSGHVFTIDNTGSLTPLFIAFTFSYSWTIAVGVDDPTGELATGGAFFHITGIDNEELTIGGVPAAEYLFQVNYSTALGQTGGTGGDVVTGGILVPAGEAAAFSVITDTTGSALSNVPEPASWSLAAVGVLSLLFRRFHKA